MTRTRRRGCQGQALVEAAIALPLFVLLLCIGIDISTYLYTRATLMNDAGLAARQATLPSNRSSDCSALTTGTAQGGAINLSGDPNGNSTTSPASGIFNPTAASSVPQGSGYVYVFPAATTSGTPSQSNCSGTSRPSGHQSTTVQITYRYKSTIPIVGNILGTLTIYAFASQPDEY